MQRFTQRPSSRRGRLSRSSDFRRVYHEGRSFANRFLVLYAFRRAAADGSGVGEEASARLGVSVSRKVGSAVVRNRSKRVIREAFGHLADDVPADFDYVVIARPPMAELAEAGGEARTRELLSELLAEARGKLALGS